MKNKRKIVALVSCVSEKNCKPQPAQLLYISDWFRKASSYAKLVADEWFILSAEHHLLTPEKKIAPYNKTLKKMGKKERMQWADNVLANLLPQLSQGDHVIILASEPYREFIIDQIIGFGCTVEIPMKGLRIGEQKRWLKKHLESLHE